MPTVRLPDEAAVPALGMGTWHMGEDPARRRREVDALRLGIELGMTLIDTAEMYGDGGAEEVVGEAIADRRDDVFIVSKVYPHNASARGAIAACERSLRRLRTDRIDCYLLHWRGRIPISETVDAFEQLCASGKIARWGVSNFDVEHLQQLAKVNAGDHCATDQVLYNVGERAADWRLLAWCGNHAMPAMAYSPVGQGALLRDPALRKIARAAQLTPSQLALAWTLRHPHVIAIPKSDNPRHLRENRAAAGIRLDQATLQAIDSAFPPPRRATRLSVI